MLRIIQQLCHVVLPDPRHGLGPRSDTQLGQDIPDMCFYRVCFDGQSLGNLQGKNGT